MTDTNAVKVSAYYEGDAGTRYVHGRQTDPNLLGYRLDYAYFKPFLNSTDVVLDFGCGNGGLLRLLKEHVSKAEGLEVNQSAVEIARTSQATVYTSIEDLPACEAYDRIISNHVLEHVRDVPSTLERLRVTLKRNGLLLLKLPIDDWRARHQRTWDREDRDHHLQTWTPRLIANVLYEAGYEPLTIDIVTSAWHPRLFCLARLGLAPLAFWSFAVLKKRRQLLVVARHDV